MCFASLDPPNLIKYALPLGFFAASVLELLNCNSNLKPKLLSCLCKWSFGPISLIRSSWRSAVSIMLIQQFHKKVLYEKIRTTAANWMPYGRSRWWGGFWSNIYRKIIRFGYFSLNFSGTKKTQGIPQMTFQKYSHWDLGSIAVKTCEVKHGGKTSHKGISSSPSNGKVLLCKSSSSATSDLEGRPLPFCFGFDASCRTGVGRPSVMASFLSWQKRHRNSVNWRQVHSWFQH